MVRWYHCIFSAYGFWLPNDPRGSWSQYVGSSALYRSAGKATLTDERRSLAHEPHDFEVRQLAKEVLKYPPVRFDTPMRTTIARGFETASREGNLVLHACAIGYDHVHVVTARHASKTVEAIAAQLKSCATRELGRAGLHPLSRFAAAGKTPTPWSHGRWKVFINDEQQLEAAMDYVQRHPEKEGLAPQAWSFLTSVG